MFLRVNTVLYPCTMQPRGVAAGCMRFALTCNLLSVFREGHVGHLAYFLRTIHAHVPTARVILVRLLTCIISRQKKTRYLQRIRIIF